jgi:(R,R)-butanediol dehydrogenase/meso-butanediol dehydrogenase/diacetyl reductase
MQSIRKWSLQLDFRGTTADTTPMRAVIFKSHRLPLELGEWPKPTPREGQVLVQVKACGICGSDLHAAHAESTPVDIVMGHELGGVVSAVGPGVTRCRVGDRVAPLSQISCGRCPACAANRHSECVNLEIIALNPKYNGGFAEYVVVGEADIVPIPDEVGFDQAALLEPLAVSLDAVRRARLGVNEVVLIVGGGPIGLTLALWSRFFGAAHVVVSEPNAHRRQLASKLGATAVIDPSQESDLRSAFITRAGRPASILFEAVGAPGFVQRCIDLAEPRSRLVIAGACQSPEQITAMSCTLKALDLIFPFGYSVEDYGFILECMRQRRIDARALISHRIGLDRVPAMFETLRRPNDECKVIVEP